MPRKHRTGWPPCARLRESGRPLSFEQLGSAVGAAAYVRTAADPTTFFGTVESTVRELDPDIPVSGMRTLDQQGGARWLAHAALFDTATQREGYVQKRGRFLRFGCGGILVSRLSRGREEKSR